MASLEQAMPYILANEGGFSDNPSDPGGATNHGITLNELSAWRHHRCSVEDVRLLTVMEATEIYRAYYWDLLNLDHVKAQGVATALMDVCVNRGPGVARQYMREIVYQMNETDVNACDPRGFVQALEKRAEEGYLAIVQEHPRMRVFLRGWLNRAKRMLGLD